MPLVTRYSLLRCRDGGLALTTEAAAGSLTAASRRDMFARGGETEARHIAVDCLVLPRRDLICLVPDANAAVCADRLVETPPRRQVRVVLAAREAFEIIEGAPELHDGNTAPVQKGLRAEKTLLRMRVQRAE